MRSAFVTSLSAKDHVQKHRESDAQSMEILWRLMPVYTSTWRCVFIQGGKEKQSKTFQTLVSRENWPCHAFWGPLHVYLWFPVMSNVLTRDYFISWGTGWPSHLPLSWVWGATGEENCVSPFPEGCVQGWSLADWKKPSRKMDFLALSVAVECLILAVGAGPGSPWHGRLSSGSITYISVHTCTFWYTAAAHPKALHWSVYTFIKKSLCIFYTSFPPDLNVLMNIYYIQLNFSSIFGCREWNLYYYLHILLLFAYLYLHLWLYY